MPTEFEQSVAEQPQQQQELHTQQQQEHQHHEEQQAEENEQYLEDITNDDKINEKTIMTTTATATNGDIMSTSQTSTSSSNGHSGMNGQNGASKKVSITSPDPTAYVAKARVTRPTPPPPSYNPMQFVQIKPCTLYQTAQQQLKKAEEVKKIKEIKKEEPEDWQNNLDNWKSSRRKRVEHIIDRVVEVKKLELEDHDRNRRKSKTFSEMIEERGERGVRAGRAKLVSLAVYNEDESNDLSDLGIGTSSASGKSSLSEDYDNNSVMSDNPELDKAIHESSHKPSSTTREYISSPGYDTSSSTAPASSPDPCEYTYEGAIQDYKQRVSRASSAGLKLNGNGIKSINASGNSASSTSKESTPERSAVNGNANAAETYPTRRGSKIEDRLMGFEVTSPSDCQEGVEKSKVDVPKIDISKRKEVFENQNGHNSRHNSEQPKAMVGGVGVPKVMLRDRFKFDATAAGNSEAQASAKKEVKRLSGDITSIRDRLQSLEQQQHHLVNGREKQSGASRLVDMPMPPLKDRLSSLQNAVTKEEVKKPPVALVDARQLEIMKNEEESAKQRIKKRDEAVVAKMPIAEKRLEQIVESSVDILLPAANLELEPDRDDSGIHTSDDIESTEERNDDDKAEEARLKVEQELQLNAAIAALALEEKQLELAASAVNQIEEEFAELTSTAAPAPAVVPPPLSSDQPPAAAVQSAIVSATNEMEFSINEALELALEAIDKETTNANKMMNDTATNDIHDVTTNNNANKINNNNKSKEANMANTTDEEKQLKSQLSRRDKVQDDEKEQTKIEVNEEAEADADAQSNNAELRIAQEPIYENITASATVATNEIIPNTNKNSNNQNHNNYDSNNSNKLSEINSNSILVDLTTTHVVELTATHNDDLVMPQTTTKIATAIPAQLVEQAAPSTRTPPPVTNIEAVGHAAERQLEPEPYYQVPKAIEPYYDAPRHLRPIPLYENIEIFLDSTTIITANGNAAFKLEPPKEKPPPPPIESPPSRSPLPYDDTESVVDNTDTWSSSDNTYETIASTPRRHHPQPTSAAEPLSPPIQQRMNSTKRIKKELRNKRSSFLGIESSTSLEDEVDSYLELTVAPPPDMAQLLQEERRLEKQLYLKAGLCDSSDTGESRDSGVSENHSRQSSEHYTVSSEDNDRDGHLDSPPTSLSHHSHKSAELIYQNETLPLPLPLLSAAQTPLLQTVKGNSAESWTESATAAAAATKSLTEATATANAKMLSLEGKLREQEEVFRVETELLQLEQEELKRNRENLLLRENIARRELQHGAKMLMSANRHSLQELNGVSVALGKASGGDVVFQPAPLAAVQPMGAPHQQIYANVPNLQQQQQQYYQQVETDYRKSMSDLNEFSKRLQLPPTPPTKPMRAMHLGNGGNGHEEFAARQRHSLNSSQHFGGSLVKIAMPTAAPRGHIYANYLQQQQQHSQPQQHRHHHHQSAQNLSNQQQQMPSAAPHSSVHHGNMTRNTLHALSATPKPKYTDGWVQVQNRKSYDSANLANDPAWLSAYQQKRKSMPNDTFQANLNPNQAAYNNHWLVQEAEQRRVGEQQQLQRRSISTGNTPVHQHGTPNGHLKSPGCAVTNGNGKPLPDSIIQSLTERVQSKGIGERKRFDNYNNNNNIMDKNKSPLHATHYIQQQTHRHHSNDLNPGALAPQISNNNGNSSSSNASITTAASTASTASTTTSPAQDKVLSVSGKKKCSHCGDELGRGAAMIIESLLLFYHINCFKCCVCHVQLGDGLNGTDVRVRNHKLHCQNCYSSDDGIKFSCV